MRVFARIFGGLVLIAALVFAGISSSSAIEKGEGGKGCFIIDPKGHCYTDLQEWLGVLAGASLEGCDPLAGYVNANGEITCCPKDAPLVYPNPDTGLCECKGDEHLTYFNPITQECDCPPGTTYYGKFPACCAVVIDGECCHVYDSKQEKCYKLGEWLQVVAELGGGGYIDQDGEIHSCPEGTYPNLATGFCEVYCGDGQYIQHGTYTCANCPPYHSCSGGIFTVINYTNDQGNEPNIYTITLKNYNNTSTRQTIYEKYNTGWYSNSGATTTLSSATVPSRTGYTFRGFYTSQQTDATSSGNTGTQKITATGGLPSNTTFTSNTNLYAAWATNCVDSSNCTLTVANNGAVTYTTSCPNGYVSGEGTYNPVCQSSSGTSNCYRIDLNNTANGGSGGAPTSVYLYKDTSNASKHCKLYTDSSCETEVAYSSGYYTIPTTNPTKSHATFKYYNKTDDTSTLYFYRYTYSPGYTGAPTYTGLFDCIYNDLNGYGFDATQTPALTLNAAYSCDEGWRGSCTINWDGSSCFSSTACTQSPTTTISFNANGGSGGRSGTVTATYGSMVPVITTSNWTTPTRFGYTFGGYTDSASSGGNSYYYDSGNPSSVWDKTASTSTLYAQWNLFDIGKLDFYSGVAGSYAYQIPCSRGGSCGPLPTYSAAGLSVPSGAVTPSGASNAFLGWAFMCNNNGTPQYCNLASGGATDSGLYAPGTSHPNDNDFFGRAAIDSQEPTYSTGLHACWNIGISYNLNGGSNPSGTPTSFNTCLGATLPTPTRENYTFDGWYDNANFTGNPVTSIAVDTTGTQTFYAKWSQNTCWHTELDNTTYGGSGGTTDIYINRSTCNVYSTSDCSGNPITSLPSLPSKTNSTYAGHFRPDEPGWGALIQTSGNDRFANLKTECNSNRVYSTLVAKYECADGWHASTTYPTGACTANSYSVHFNSNCPTTVSGTMNNQSFTYGTAQNLTDNAFSCTNNSFQGWAISADGSADYTNGQSVNNLTTTNNGTFELYAVWSPSACDNGQYLSDGSCNSCPTGYTSNGATATAETDCYVTCTKGTRVKDVHGVCVSDANPWFTTSSQKVYYGRVSAVSFCMGDPAQSWGYKAAGTTAAGHDAQADCVIGVAAGYEVSKLYLDHVDAISIENASTTQDLRLVEIQALDASGAVVNLVYDSTNSVGVTNPANSTNGSFTNNVYTTIKKKTNNVNGKGVWTYGGNLSKINIGLVTGHLYDKISVKILRQGVWYTVVDNESFYHTSSILTNGGQLIYFSGLPTACSGGTYQDNANSLGLGNTRTCDSVPAGYWNDGCGTNNTGGVCSNTYHGGQINAGYYGSAGATSASGDGACAIGSWSAAGSSECTACVAGTTTSDTGSTSSSACSSCSNASNVATWTSPVAWSSNTVSNLCVISTCATGYNRTGNSPYQCTAGTYTISLDSDYYSSASATVATAVDTAASPASIKEHYGIGWLKSDGTNAFAQLDTLPAYGNRLFYGFWTGKTGTGTKIINSDGSLADATATVFSSNSTAYAKWSAANVCECTKGTNVSTCSSTGVTDNKCQYSYTCANGYTVDGSATSGTFEGAVGTPSNESPACNSAGNYSITYVLNGGLDMRLGTYTPVEYISSKSANSAFSYFDTGTKFDFSKDFRVVGSFSNPSTSARHILLGSYYDSGNILNIELKSSPAGALRTYFAGGAENNTPAIAANTWTAYDVFYDPVSRKSKSIAGSNNFTVSVPNGTGEVARSMRMFLDYRSSPSSVANPVKMAATAIYKNNALANYYIPVRDANNVCGMYDAFNEEFKASSTAAPFDCPSTTTMPKDFAYDTGATISGVPVRAHSQFAGWCTNAALTQGCAMTKTITANSTTSPQTFYAKWTCDAGYHASGNACVANSISLSWTTAHGSNPSTPSSCTYGGTFTAPAAITGVTGYTFGGWSVNGNTFAAGATISCNEISLGAVTGTVSIAAVWTAHTYTVTFDTNGASGSPSVDSITCTYGQNCPAFASQGTMSSGSDNFGGWNTAADGSGTTYAEGATPSNLTSTDGATITMYAIWTQTVVTCGAGYYLPANSSSASDCAVCTAGNYCPGGNNFIPSSNSAQGINACPSGLTTPNDTETKRHDEAGDCGRPFHLGTDTLWLRSSKKTHTQDSKLATVALNFDYFAANGTAVKDGGTPDGVADLFLNLSTTASPMPTTNKNFKMTVNGSTVYGCDDGTCQ